MPPDFDQLPERRNTESLKWRVYPPEVLPMWVADMDFPSPQPVIKALRRRVEHGVFGYPTTVHGDGAELPELTQVILSHLFQRYGWVVRPEEVHFIPGVVTGFNLVCHMVREPGAEVVMQTPVYTPFLDAPGNAGLSRRDVLLSPGEDGAFRYDPDEFEASLTPQARLFILCNPHNPVGRVFRKDELEQMAGACLRKGVLICSDEIHSDLIFSEHKHIPLATLDPEIAQNTITLISPSKTYNLAGLAFSIAIIQNRALLEKFKASKQGLVSWANILGLAAAEAAYREGQEWLTQLLAYLEGNRDFLDEILRSELPALQMKKPEGTYLAWIDCRQAGIPGNPYRFFLKKGQVALADGSTFGPGGEGYVRLNFGCPRPMLAEALRRMKSALSNLA